MNIAYSALCATCKEAGKDSRLHRDLSAPETIFCNEGHKFSGPEIEDYLTAAPDVQVVPMSKADPEIVFPPPIPPAVVEELERELQEAVERTSPFELSPPPSAPDPGNRAATALVEQAKANMADSRRGALEKARAPQAAVAVAEPEPAARPAPTSSPTPSQPRKPVKSLPGGALEITVVIPDPHANYLQGEAEFRGKTVQEHFEEIMLAGMDSRWWY